MIDPSSGQKTTSYFRKSSIPVPLDLGRRAFLATAAAATATVASTSLGREYGKDYPPVRYPDPDIVVLDPRFSKYKIGNTPIQRLYHSKKMLWAEGPAWNNVGGSW